MSSYGSCDRFIETELCELEQAQKVESTETKKKGLTIYTTSLFIAGEMAGSGVLALPKAIVNTGYIGLVLLLIFGLNAIYGGIKLGECWNIVEDRYPQHRKGTRNPYAVIAEKAVGKFGSKLVSYSIRFTLFGCGTTYLLLASQIVQTLLNDALPTININFCTYFILIAFCMIIPMWLGTPKEFSIVGLIAIGTTFIACVLFTMQILIDIDSKNLVSVKHDVHGFNDFFLSFGTLLFAFGGASTFPTIQNDMENKKQFSKSIIIALCIILIIYLPITVGGFFAYGEDIKSNVTLSLSKGLLVDIGNILIAIHLVFAFLIVMNPVCQDLEEAFGISHYFNWTRCVLRSIMVLLMVVIGEIIPEFGKILSLVGGSTITLLTFVLPPFFYMRLCAKDQKACDKRVIPLHEKVYMWELILVGIGGGCASTYTAINAILSYDYHAKPCFF